MTPAGPSVAGPAIAAPAAVDEALADGSAPAPAVADHEFAPLPGPAGPSGAAGGRTGPIELLHEVEMGVTVELGRTRLLVRDILDLSPGSVIELDRAAGAPIDVLVNGTLIARGEVVVIDEEFGIRITEVIGYQSR
jgi:flagellar motor switch protein FliN/FliY